MTTATPMQTELEGRWVDLTESNLTDSLVFSGIPSLVILQPEGIIRIALKMYVVESKGGAIACMLLALFFLGTWPAVMTLLERRGRLPQHTYLDYSITNLLAAVIIAFTFGEIGKSTHEAPNFSTQLSQLSDNWPSVMFAMAGGVVLSLGNLSTQYAWAFVGLSVTEVITASITVVIGTTLNYFLDDKINNAKILFPGVGCFLIAVCLASAVHSSNADDNRAKLSCLPSDDKHRSVAADITQSGEAFPVKERKAKFGTADFLVELENRRAIKVFGKSTLIGLAITFFAGLCFSLFSPAFNLASNDQWHTLKKGVPNLVVYTAFFWFSVSCFVLAIILNVTFLYHPVLDLPRSSLKAYINDWNGRGWALLAGLLCGFGNGLQFMGGQAAGYAAADAVQALPLVSTFWGILLFGEYRKSSRRTYVFLASMLLMFIVAVAVLMASAGHRKVNIVYRRSSIMIPYIVGGEKTPRPLVESKGGAIVCMLFSLFFLGTWPAIMTLLERRGRLPQHTYLDYSITNLLAAVIIALTFGEIGNGRPNFTTQLSQDNWPSIMFAMAGGVVLSLGNLSTQYAWAFVGLSVTEVITSSITVVIGTTLNYFLDDKINRAEILFPGVGCFLIAVCLGSAVHSSNAADNRAKLKSLTSDKKNVTATVGSSAYSNEASQNKGVKDLENGSSTPEKAKAGTADFLVDLENRRSIKVFGRNTSIGLSITFFAGLLTWQRMISGTPWKKGVPKLVVYTAFFWFSISCFVLAIILNVTFLYFPVLNLPSSSLKAYLNDWNGRGWAFLAGLLCGFGNGLQFMGGQAAGYAAADAVQALPLVSTFWGVLIFGEYRKSSRRTYILLVNMLFMFIAAVGILMASSGHRK
uniref:Ureide permease n=1 Tax=Salix viminalis TaxID=40686 RepID=A0A6N2M7T6_SALVM